MNLFTISAGQIATNVWNNVTRTLTDLYASLLNVENASALTVTTSAVQGVFGTYVQVVASLAHNVRFLRLTVFSASLLHGKIGIATGAGGSEVNQHVVSYNIGLANQTVVIHVPVAATLFPKAARLSLGTTNDGAASAVAVLIAVDAVEDNA